MNIEQATAQLIKRGDISDLLKLADKYMEVYRADRKRFHLPPEHELLEPVVKYYASRTKGFAKYILNIRNSFARGGNEYAALNKLYRNIFTRAVQQERRARADLAVKLAIDAYGEPPSFQERLTWIARREADWANQRLAFLDKQRAKAASGRLNREETNDLLAEFWESIDQELRSKGVPAWEK